MKDTGVKIKIDIEGIEEIKALRNELEALTFLVDGVEKCTSKFIEKYETLKKIASEDEAKKLGGEIEAEIKTKELPEESDSNKTTSKDSFLTSNEVENTAQLVAKKMVESMNQSDNQE